MAEQVPYLAISGFITIALGLVLLLIAMVMAKTKQFARHKILMQIAVIVTLSFLIQYIIRFSLGQETHFEGDDTIKNYVYLPILTVHILFALTSIYMIIRHLLETRRNELKGPQFKKEYRMRHRSYGKWTFIIWFSSFVGGIIIFFMLYVIPF
ncbi:MAG: DUF420 domain-containing protein [Candidatus Heimdallarchaeota archaeon]|nr:DUF420 domain-containing protein [Candidatus Heimdallarchaeota archaeon]